MKQKYGGRGLARADILEKYKKTCKEKFGTENISITEEIKNKIKNTNLKKYGHKNVFQNPKIKQKIKNTIKEKYNVDHISKSEYFKTSIKNSWSKRSIKDKEKIKQKRKTTCLKKYGVEHNSQLIDFKNKITLKNKKKAFNRILSISNIQPLFTMKEYLGCNKNHLFKCTTCKNIFEDTIDDGSQPRCPICFPKTISNIHKQILDFIKDLGFKPIVNDRIIIKPKEIDIFIPEKKIGIEINGLYWHSDTHNKDRNKHIEKTELCDKKNVNLIHIFEHELINDYELVKSRLKSLLGKNEYKIHGRKCIIKEIDNETTKTFLNNNHLQKYVYSKINLGLFLNNNLLSVMTFGHPRFNKKYEWELIRYSTLKNTTVIGGANKLLRYFINEFKPKSIISYADRRWSVGNFYNKIGFIKSHSTQPNYWYFKNKKIFNRIKFQKHKLPKILEKFDINLSEWENMKNNGYNRIWDCGTIAYVWKNL